MKKIFLLLLSIIFSLSLFNITLATDSTYFYVDENGELVESGDFLADQNVTLIEDEDDYESLYAGETPEDYQEEYKKGFEEQQETLTELSDEYPISKLIITDIKSDIRTEYTYSYDYSYNPIYYAVQYQLATIKAEDGTETNAIILLSSNLYADKNIKPLKIGDTIYANMQYCDKNTEEGSQIYNLLNHGLSDDIIALVYLSEEDIQAGLATQDRLLGIILLTILTVLLLLLYSGKHGGKLLIPLFVAIDLLFVVLVPEIALGKNIILLAILISLELIILIATLKHGWSKKTVVTILSSLIIMTLITFLGMFFANTNRLNGNGLISEKDYSLLYNPYYVGSIIKTTINMTHLYLAIILILSSTISATVSSRIVDLVEKYAGTKDMTNNIIEESKLIIGDYPIIISIIFFIMHLPKYMIMTYNNTGFIQVINSDMLATDVSLLLLTLISAIIASPITAIIGNLLMGEVEIKQIAESSKKNK